MLSPFYKVFTIWPTSTPRHPNTAAVTATMCIDNVFMPYTFGQTYKNVERPYFGFWTEVAAHEYAKLVMGFSMILVVKGTGGSWPQKTPSWVRYTTNLPMGTMLWEGFDMPTEEEAFGDVLVDVYASGSVRNAWRRSQILGDLKRRLDYERNLPA